MAAAELPAACMAAFVADWASGGARARPHQPSLAPAESSGEGLRSATADVAAQAVSLQGDGAEQAALITAEDAAVERVAACAVSLAFLRDFYARCVRPLEAGGAALTTKEVVLRLIMPATEAAACNFAAMVPGAVAPPTAFASHAFGNPFGLLVSALEEHFMNAVAADVFVWVDIFAINQHDPGADLHGGRALARTIDLVGETLVVLDKAGYPLTRLWCLYEMGSTPPDKLRLLTPGFREAELAAVFRAVDVKAADCYESTDKSRIQEHIVARYETLAAFQQMLRLRLLLKPTSYEADRDALLKRSNDTWRFEELRTFVGSQGDESRLACIPGGPGEGKSTLAAALCGASPSLVHAHHFCKASDVRRQDVGEIIRSLAYQLALHFPAFAEALLALEQADVESLSDPAKAWQLLLRQPLQLLRGARVVLLFDALDEAGGTDRTISNVLSLVLDLGRIVNGASLIVTTRPETGIVAALRGRWRNSAHDFAPATLRDGDEQSKLLALLRDARPDAPFVTVDAAYAAMFDAATASLSNSVDTRQLLSILMAARQPPSMALLESMKVRGACAQLPGWGFLFQEREHCVHLLHKSLAEWLQDRSRSAHHFVDVASGHRTWAEFLSAQLRPWLVPAPECTAAAAPPKGTYAYAHLLSHLDAAGLQTEARATLLRLPWLQATLRERGLYALLSDVAAFMAQHDTLLLLHRTLRLAAPGLQGSDAAEALPGQLVGRLGGLIGNAAPEVVELYNAARKWRGSLAWLYSLTPTLSAPVGALELCLEGHADKVMTVLKLADGRVVSGSKDSTLRVWNAVTGECERTLEGHTGEVTSVVELADGSVVSGSRDKSLRVWNVVTGECERALEGHADSVRSVLKLADGRVASGSHDNTLRVWNAATGKCERILGGHTSKVESLVALANGRVVSASWDKTLRVWNGATDDCDHTLEAHTGTVLPVVALAGGRVVSGSEDKTLRVWDTATGRCNYALAGHTDRVVSVAALADGRVVSASWDKTLRVWNVDEGACVRTLEGHTQQVTSVIALGDGRLVSGSYDCTLRVWDADKGECRHALKGHTGAVLSVAALANGRVVSASADHTLRVWNAATDERERALAGHASSVESVVALTDGRVVSRSADMKLRVWDAATGVCERTLDGHTDRVESIAALPNGRVVSASADNTVRVWNAASGACEHTLAGHTDRAVSVAALADGRAISASWDTTLRVWNVDEGGCERILEGHTHRVTSVVQLADGRVVSGSYDKTLRIWNATTGACEPPLEGHSEMVLSVAVLADGRVLSGSYDETFRVWNAATRLCERVVLLSSAEAITLSTLPRLPVLGSCLELGACEQVAPAGSSLLGAGFARMYVDADVTEVVAVLTPGRAASNSGEPCDGGNKVIVAATSSGAMHFFTVCARL